MSHSGETGVSVWEAGGEEETRGTGAELRCETGSVRINENKVRTYGHPSSVDLGNTGILESSQSVNHTPRVAKHATYDKTTLK